jgi:hypothetical protein
MTKTLNQIIFHMLSVSLDCPFLIASSIFSNVYLKLKSTLTLSLITLILIILDVCVVLQVK